MPGLPDRVCSVPMLCSLDVYARSVVLSVHFFSGRPGVYKETRIVSDMVAVLREADKLSCSGSLPTYAAVSLNKLPPIPTEAVDIGVLVYNALSKGAGKGLSIRRKAKKCMRIISRVGLKFFHQCVNYEAT